MLLCDRPDYGELVRLLTGHNFLNRHSFLLGETETADCRLCNESEETSEHLLCDCPVLSDTRFRILGKYQVSPMELSCMPMDGIRRYTSLLRGKLSQNGLDNL